MKLFNRFSTDIAIDLGTVNTMIMHKGKVVLNEPSIIAINRSTGKLLSYGTEALEMHQKSPTLIKTIWPLQNGVISNFQAAQQLINHMVKSAITKHTYTGINGKRLAVCIPYCATEVEKRAVRDVAEGVGANELFMIHEPIAAALGMNLDISRSEGNMIIDIGGGTTEFAIISLSGVVCSQSIMEAGRSLDAEIIEYIRKNHNLLIGERTAEKVKKEIGVASLDPSFIKPASMNVVGRDLFSGLPKSITINNEEIFYCLDNTFTIIENALLTTIEICPPELLHDICEKGIYLAGGCSNIKGLDKRLEKVTGIKVNKYNMDNSPVLQGIAMAMAKSKNQKHVLFK